MVKERKWLFLKKNNFIYKLMKYLKKYYEAIVDENKLDIEDILLEFQDSGEVIKIFIQVNYHVLKTIRIKEEI